MSTIIRGLLVSLSYCLIECSGRRHTHTQSDQQTKYTQTKQLSLCKDDFIPAGSGSNVDYTSSTPTLTFDSSTSLQCVRIPITDDDNLEEDERFTVSLSTNEPDVTLNPRNGEVIILNDDGQFP